jgi:DNA-binding winged helix-turn-helix (wHTH) protein/tetratricopeptide (TPR) repeat protein
MAVLRYASHHVVLEPSRWRVRVGDDWFTPEPKVFELLSYLMRHHGRVIPKAELLDCLWAGDVVGESVLTRCISCARKLLSDDPKAPRFIRTSHGRGYEFVAPVVMTPLSTDETTLATEPLGSQAGAVVESRGQQRPFIGRETESAHLEQALRRLERREPGFFLVCGEAGIGKTRLLERATETAPHSIDVHWGRCSALEGAPVLQVWHDCFRSIIKKRSIKIVRRAFEDAPSGARRLLLGLDRWQPQDQLGWDSPSERFRAFDAIVRGLGRLAERQPLAIVLDDLHVADSLSLLLLEFLIQQQDAPLLLLGATREVQPLLEPSRFGALARIRAACRDEIGLTGFSRDELEQFVRERFGSAQDATGDALLARTGGNPFFLSVLTSGQDLPRVGEAPLPAAIRQATSQRLSALTPECVHLLRVGAVCGQSFDILPLARAAALPVERCGTLLRQAEAARIITTSGSNEYRFIHDLIREVLYEELTATERPLVHLAVGQALQTQQSYQDARYAAMLAHHFRMAAHCGGASSAIDLSIRAGAYALRNFAYEEAIEHFAEASRLLPLSPEVDQATECAVLLDLGLAQISAGQREAGQSTLHLAAQKARQFGGIEELTSVALNLAPGVFAIETGVYDPGLVGLMREALELVDDTDPKLRALLLARLALAMYWSDTFAERAAICDEAEAISQTLASDEVKARVATSRLFALLRPLNLEERRELSDRALELCQRVGDRDGLMLTRLQRAAIALELGDIAGQAFEADAFRMLAEETNQPQAVWIVAAQRACRLFMQGELEQVERLAGACLIAGQRVQDHNALGTFGLDLTLVRIEQSRADEILAVVRDYAARYPRILGWRVVYANALYRAGRSNECAVEYASLKAAGFALPHDLLWMGATALLVEVCSAQHDVEGADTLYDRLLPFASRLVVLGYAGIVCLGSVERFLALMAATRGRHTDAERHFQRAVEVNRATGATLPLAHTLCDLAAWSTRAGQTERARAALHEAQLVIETRDLPDLTQRLAELKRAHPP